MINRWEIKIIDRTFLRLSTIFTIIKSFALLSIKRKKYPISKWFGTSLHQKEIKKNPAKPPEIPFHPVSKFLDIYPNPNARSSHPPPFENRHPYNRYPRPFNPSTKNPSQTSNIQLRYPTSRRECQYLILKGGGEAGNHTRRAISRGIRWVEYARNTRRDASKVMPCHVVDIWIARGPNRSRG